MAVKSTAGRTKRALAFLILFGPAFILVFIATRGCNHKFKELADYGKAVDYTFIDAEGEEHNYKEFSDRVVLITTLQPECPDECSISFWHINQLIYQHVRKNKKKLGSVRIISFVTDGHGKPLKDMSTVRDMMMDKVEGYDPEIWYLASGNPEELYDFESNNESLLKKGDEFHGGEAYQELMLLLDKRNHLRMVLSGKSEGMIRRMKEHIALLQKQYDKKFARDEKNQ